VKKQLTQSKFISVACVKTRDGNKHQSYKNIVKSCVSRVKQASRFQQTNNMCNNTWRNKHESYKIKNKHGETNTKPCVITRGEAYIKVINQQTNSGCSNKCSTTIKTTAYQRYKPHRVKQHVMNQTSKL